MQHELEQATRDNNELLKTRNDRWYPQLHIAARAGWINDPNGLCYFNGRYHVFFQHHPAGTNWGPMHWGHVSSADLRTWRHEPIALAPSLPADKDGIFSGSAAIADDGTLMVFYTGNAWGPNGPDGAGNSQTQMLATSTDAVTFEKQGVLVEAPGYPDFRDPKVWRQGDLWCMIVGVRSAEDRGQVWLYTSNDMHSWEFNRVIFEDPDPDVYMIECPDLFEIDGRWILLYGPMTHARPTGYAGRNGHNCGYLVGDWELGGSFVATTQYRPLDWGHNYYAPQTFLAPDGRRIVIGWMGGFTLPLASQAEDGWSGQMAVPRELALGDDGRLRAQPIRELTGLRVETKDWGPVTLQPDEERILFEGNDGVELHAVINLAKTSAEQVGFNVHRTDGGRSTWVGYDDLSGRVVLDRRTVGHTDAGYRSAPVDHQDELELRILVDRGSVEVFIGDCAETLSSLSFPVDGPRSISIDAAMGSASIESLQVHRLGSIWETTENSPE